MDVRTSTRLARERTAVPNARAFVRHALNTAGAPSDSLDPLVLAVAEACNNAILHAAGDAFGVTLVVEGTHVTVTVSDTGAGFVPPARPQMPSPEATDHRGLALMQALVDRVRVSSDAKGTVVVLEQSLGPAQPASLAAERRPAASR
ncbi:MAG TPA: ATP-binding protein [Acidimicrobiales bacterium]|nr:ATP-binding protein [Acidimicrobiales bacterium]